jgi:GTPase SAR1 family protein
VNQAAVSFPFTVLGSDNCWLAVAVASATPRTACPRYKLNIWDVGGQKTLRPYWRNYYEKTDGLIWVVDSADLARLEDCRKELHSLLQEERLCGATLLILANKQDIPSALSLEEIEKVCSSIAGHKGIAEHGQMNERTIGRCSTGVVSCCCVFAEETAMLLQICVAGPSVAHVVTLLSVLRAHCRLSLVLCLLLPLLQVLDLGSITKRHIRTVACSAHTGDGLLDAFEWLVKDISSRIYLFGQ